MAAGIIQKLYAKLPVPLQNLACSVAGLQSRRRRYNATFWAALEELREADYWSSERQQALCDEQLQRVIRHAYESVPYYRELMDERRLKPTDFRTASDLPKLPLLTKKVVRERFDDLISRSWPTRRRLESRTGGTTGTALRFLQDVDTQPWQWAIWWRHRGRFGLTTKHSCVTFSNRPVIPLGNAKPPIWRHNLPMHQTYVTVQHMTARNMKPLTEYLQQRSVEYYSGYPSALYTLATYMLENDIRLCHPPRVVVTGAETLLPHQRRMIENVLDTEVADQYGASEHCGNISECERHSYHVDMELGAMEFLPLANEMPNLYRIICTGFRNPVMPLIRYDIGDIATVSEKKCPCGRQSPVVDRIDGRIDSFILTPDGRRLGRLAYLFKDTANIEEAQLIQDQIERVRVRIVPTNRFTIADETALLKTLRETLGDVIEIEIERVNEIPRESNGKFRQIVSSVFKDKYADATPRQPID